MDVINRQLLSDSLTSAAAAIDRDENVTLSPRAKFLISQALVTAKEAGNTLTPDVETAIIASDFLAMAATDDRVDYADRAMFSAALRDLSKRLRTIEEPRLVVPIEGERRAQEETSGVVSEITEVESNAEKLPLAPAPLKPNVPERARMWERLCEWFVDKAESTKDVLKDHLQRAIQPPIDILRDLSRTRTPDIIESLENSRILSVSPIFISGAPALQQCLWTSECFVPVGSDGKQVPLEVVARGLGISARDIPAPKLISECGARNSYEADAVASLKSKAILLPLPIETELVGLSFYDGRGNELAGKVEKRKLSGGVVVEAPDQARTLQYRVALSEKTILEPSTFEQVRAYADRHIAAPVIMPRNESLPLAGRVSQLKDILRSDGLTYCAHPLIARTLRRGHSYLSSTIAGLLAGTCDPMALIGPSELGSESTVGLVLTGFSPKPSEDFRHDAVLDATCGHAISLITDGKDEILLDLTGIAPKDSIDISRSDLRQARALIRSLAWDNAEACLNSGKLVRAEIDRHLMKRNAERRSRLGTGHSSSEVSIPLEVRLESQALIARMESGDTDPRVLYRAAKCHAAIQKALVHPGHPIFPCDNELRNRFRLAIIDTAWLALVRCRDAKTGSALAAAAIELFGCAAGREPTETRDVFLNWLRNDLNEIETQHFKEGLQRHFSSGRALAVPVANLNQIASIIASCVSNVRNKHNSFSPELGNALGRFIDALASSERQPSRGAMDMQQALAEFVENVGPDTARPLIKRLAPAFKSNPTRWYRGFFVHAPTSVGTLVPELLEVTPSGRSDSKSWLSKEIVEHLLSTSKKRGESFVVDQSRHQLVTGLSEAAQKLDLSPWSAKLLAMTQRELVQEQFSDKNGNRYSAVAYTMPRPEYPASSFCKTFGWFNASVKIAEALLKMGAFTEGELMTPQVQALEGAAASEVFKLLAKITVDAAIDPKSIGGTKRRLATLPSVIERLEAEPQLRAVLSGFERPSDHLDEAFENLFDHYAKEANDYVRAIVPSNPVARAEFNCALVLDSLSPEQRYRAAAWAYANAYTWKISHSHIIRSSSLACNDFASKAHRDSMTRDEHALHCLNVAGVETDVRIGPMTAMGAWYCMGTALKNEHTHTMAMFGKMAAHFKTDRALFCKPTLNGEFWNQVIVRREIRVPANDCKMLVHNASTFPVARVRNRSQVVCSPLTPETSVLFQRSAGRSGELFDSRSYQPGDDLRELDHAYFARTDERIVRVREERIRAKHTHIILDPEFISETAKLPKTDEGSQRALCHELGNFLSIAHRLDIEHSPYTLHVMWRGSILSKTFNKGKSSGILSDISHLRKCAQHICAVQEIARNETEFLDTNPFPVSAPFSELKIQPTRDSVILLAIGSRNVADFRRELETVKQRGTQVVLLKSKGRASA